LPFRGWRLAPLRGKTLANVAMLRRGRCKQIPEALQGSQQQVFGGHRGSDFPGVEHREETIQLVKCLIRR
jgi:hypothetical protein